MPRAQPDLVDHLVARWAAERPDLADDLPAMATFGRLGRLAALAGRSIDATFADFGLSTGEFDVLAALRRAGEPFVMMPSELSRTLMLSPAGMTNRLDRLESSGHIQRRHDPKDRRSSPVVLTALGREVVDRAVTAHVANEARLLAALSGSERAALDRALRRLLATLERPD
jgi:DNA-binding MarR family transcriptional regulator